MKKKYVKMIFCLLMLLLTLAYTYYFMPIVDDELYNYGFSYSIINGLVPYKDFNMIVPPMFSYILASLLKIFGSKLVVYHGLLACIIVLIFFIAYKSIGIKSFVLYFLMLIYPYAGYNMFAMMLLFILFYINDKKIKKLDIIEPIIISIMFLTKQTLGLLVIPSLIYSRNKKKTLAIYFIFIFGFLIYLISNGTVLSFFDYCLFGMFDFAENNSTSFSLLMIIEAFIIISLGYFSFKTKRKDLFFCLMFQIMALPIVNYIHFLISFVPVVYLFLKQYNNNQYVLYLSLVTIISFFLTFNIVYWIDGQKYSIVSHFDANNFMKDRVTYMYMDNFIYRVNDYVERYDKHKLFTFGSFSYLIKLNLDIPINKYDLINDGNMGYNGAENYVKEINDYCELNKCMFIINDYEEDISKYVQTNKQILDYVKEKYSKVYSSNVFSVYIN